MPSPLEQLETGIKTRNWKLVASVFYTLTGKKIDVDDELKQVKRKKTPTKNDVDDLKDIKVDGFIINNPPVYQESKQDNGSKRETKSEQIRPGKHINMFVDDMTEALGDIVNDRR